MANLGNVVGLLRSQTPPTKKYVLWAKILNPAFPDIVEVNYWDEVTGTWTPVTDSTHQFWLKPVISNAEITPPATPAEGDRYMVAAGGTGDWAGKDDQIATYKNSAWVFQVPLDGYMVSVRTEANKLYDYRGTYGAGGGWVENDFQVPVAPGTYIPSTEKAAALGVATLDSSVKVPQAQLDHNNFAFSPETPANWPAGTNTIKKALDFLILAAGGGGGGGLVRTIVDVTGATITLAMGELTQVCFIGSEQVTGPKTIAFSGTTNAVQIPSFIIDLSGAHALTFPANVKIFDAFMEGAVWTPEEGGKYEFHFTYDGTDWYGWVRQIL